MSIKAQQR